MNRQERRAAARASTSLRAKLEQALAHFQAGRLDQAESLLRAALAAQADNPDTLHLLGLVAYQRGAYAQSEQWITRAIKLLGNSPVYWNNLGNAQRALGRRNDAAESYRRAAALAANYAEAHNNLGIVLHDLGRYGEAEAAYRRALALAPGVAEAHKNLGTLLGEVRRFEEAAQHLRRACELEPGDPEAWTALGDALRAQRRPANFPAAVESYDKALALAPRHAAALKSAGLLLHEMGRHQDAADRLERARAIAGDDFEALTALGGARMFLGRLAGAAEAYRRALALRPDDDGARIHLREAELMICDWSGYADFDGTLKRAAATGSALEAGSVFWAAAPSLGPAEQLALARGFARAVTVRAGGAAPPKPAAPAERAKLRIGYVSADFREHAVAYCTAELFELHDRSRFEVLGYSLGPDDGSALRRRLEGAFDRFADLKGLELGAAAERIAADGVDILVDLMGYTLFSAPELLARRPAPVQAAFLGYPQTMGATFIDYLVADRFVCPPERAADYAEALAYLPDCYMPCDRKRAIASPAPTRAQCGLPDNAFVFCCFNNTWKMAPATFHVWMSLLEEVPGSVLWLRDINSEASENLKRHAAAAGIDPARLVFAGRLPYAEHLARYACADLFLDTFPYTAHATASDALWAGLPLLTTTGETFASRVCGSLLRAAELPELVTADLDDYRRTALRLARERGELAALRRRLAERRDSCALFDTPRFARSLEALFARMWERHAAGLGPGMIDLAADAPAPAPATPA